MPALETVTLLGSVSVNAAAVAADESVLLKVMVSVETAPVPIEAGVKALRIVVGNPEFWDANVPKNASLANP